jgi:large subunit ribosomal protein L10
MPTQRKIDSVAELKDRIEQATLIAGTEYRGLRVKEMQDFGAPAPGRLGSRSSRTRSSGRPTSSANGMVRIIEGPTALAIAYGDIIEASKAVAAYAQGAPSTFAVRGGYMDGTVLSANDLRDLVRIPPRPVLIAQFMGQMKSPLATFIGLLDSPLRELTGLFQALLSELPGLVEARAKQLEAA